MAQAVTDFLRNSSLVGLLNILTAVAFILTGLLLSLSRTSMRLYNLFGLALVPLLLGLVTMFVDNYILDHGLRMFPISTTAELAQGRRLAFLDGLFGVLGALAFVGTVILGRKKVSRRHG